MILIFYRKKPNSKKTANKFRQSLTKRKCSIFCFFLIGYLSLLDVIIILFFIVKILLTLALIWKWHFKVFNTQLLSYFHESCCHQNYCWILLTRSCHDNVFEFFILLFCQWSIIKAGFENFDGIL